MNNEIKSSEDIPKHEYGKFLLIQICVLIFLFFLYEAFDLFIIFIQYYKIKTIFYFIVVYNILIMHNLFYSIYLYK